MSDNFTPEDIAIIDHMFSSTATHAFVVGAQRWERMWTKPDGTTGYESTWVAEYSNGCSGDVEFETILPLLGTIFQCKNVEVLAFSEDSPVESDDVLIPGQVDTLVTTYHFTFTES